MIWIDSSFAVEWLLGTDRAALVRIEGAQLGILPAQYAEVLAFFAKRARDLTAVVQELEALELAAASKTELQRAAELYVAARRVKSKASLADSILASVARARNETLASFDDDFAQLGSRQDAGLWSPVR